MSLSACLFPRRGRAVAGVVLALFAATTLWSQDRPVLNHPTEDRPTLNRPAESQPDQAVKTITVEVKVVNVLATVRDKHGAPLTNLGKDDFKVEEDGRPQAIKYFALEKDVPLTMGVLVDTSMSQRNANQQERSASAAFFDKVLREKDQAFLLHFDREVELLQDLTPSRQKLRDAVADLQTARQSRDDEDNSGSGGQQGGNSGGGRGGYGGHRARPRSLLYDAIFLSSDELMKKQKGRKALIVLTDGVDHDSKIYLQKAIESAQRSDTVVYAIYYPGEEPRRYGFGNDDDRDRGGGMGRRGGMGGPGIGMPPMGGGGGGRGGGRPRDDSREETVDGKKILERIARETGGRMFEVSKKHTVEQAFDQIQEDLRSQYFLGYTPDRPGTLGDYRKIHVSTKQADTAVQARDGYYVAQ